MPKLWYNIARKNDKDMSLKRGTVELIKCNSNFKEVYKKFQ